MENSGSENYEKHVQKDKKDALIELRQSRERTLEAEGILSFGPTYHIHTNSGRDLQIATIFHDYPNSPSSLPFKNIQLVAEDTMGTIVATRRTQLYENKDVVIAHGGIVTFERGAGIAIPLELTHQDLLSRLATSMGKEILHIVIDENISKLINRKQGMNKFLPLWNRPDLQMIQAKEAEHNRWLSLYGDNGLLGYTLQKKKYFPLKDAPPIDAIDTITLVQKREEINGKMRAIAQLEKVTTVQSPQDLHKQRFAYYHNVLDSRIVRQIRATK